jgi:hypothetical protein
VGKRFWFASILGIAVLAPAICQRPGASAFAGRWDLTVNAGNTSYPSWMELVDEGGQPAVRIVGRSGSARSVEDGKIAGSHLSFTSTESFGKPIKVTWDLHVQGDKLTGKQHRADGIDYDLTGVRAPALRRKAPATWAKPEPLFDGKDLAGWEPDNPSTNHWKAENGELANEKRGANIRTTRRFEDFKLHIEYNCPQGGNSGVYLRGRYEVQVEYEAAGKNDKYHSMGSIYGFIAPSLELPQRPGRWESYDITLVGRTVTVVRDDVTIIDNQTIPGITGGAIDSHENEPGPLYIQGDHTGGMKYRNIIISVPEQYVARARATSSR